MISVDPGVNGCGWARWDAFGRLAACGYSRHLPYDSPVVVEVPQIYPGVRSKGNPNDLIRVAFAAGRAVGLSECQVVKPREWKGTIKKEVMLKRILKSLDDKELQIIKDLKLPKSVEHNVVDACGLGLWYLKRL